MIAAFFTFLSFHADDETPVRATLADGQVLMGEVRTRTLRLETGAGVLEVPLSDVGEVVPASSGPLLEAEGQVNVWLRNGSELRGRWADPQLAMGIAVGGDEVPVSLPMNELTRFQLQGGAAWPQGPVYRMRTSWGDDLLVDPTRTTLVLENQLGSFAPTLAECVSVAPVGAPDGDWRVQLGTGTVLIGKLRDDALTVALPMGPKEVTVPLANFVSLKMESWGAPVAAQATVVPYGGAYAGDYPATAAPMPVPEESARRRKEAAAPARSDDGWFDNDALEATKAAMEE